MEIKMETSDMRTAIARALQQSNYSGLDAGSLTSRIIDAIYFDSINLVLRADVILFDPDGKYYTIEEWRIPLGAIGPWDMVKSVDFHRIAGGPVLVPTQEPWGYPHLFVADDKDEE